jgi:predicted aldo/keto reductase-like oxidoreductase
MSHKDAAEYFIGRMDIQGLDKLLDYREYSDIEKPAFLEKLNQVFDKLREAGNTRLHTTCGTCRGCQHGHKGNAYIGDVDDSYIEVLIFTENERVSDIFECNQFEYETFDKTYLGKKISLNMNGDSEYPF